MTTTPTEPSPGEEPPHIPSEPEPGPPQENACSLPVGVLMLDAMNRALFPLLFPEQGK